MKFKILYFALYSFMFCFFVSCTFDKSKSNDTIEQNEIKEVEIAKVIKYTADPFLNDYASIICGEQPVKYFLSISNTDSWKKIKTQIDNEWQYVIESKVNKIRPWADSVMNNMNLGGNLIYPFAGADFLFANLFFENADSTVMIGLEEPGSIMADTLNTKSFLSHISKVYNSLYFSNHAGFFRTLSMKDQMNEPELSGTIPVLLFYMKKMGYSIFSLKNIEFDSIGNVTPDTSKKSYACQIDYFNQDNKLKKLFYIKYDLSNHSLNKDKKLIGFLNKFSKPNVLIKSASYLMRYSNFSIIRDYLLNNSRCILQDDSGIPYRFFEEPIWGINLFGKYSKVIPLFEESFQPDLQEAYQSSTVRNLPFSIGYNINHGEPNLMLLTKKKEKL